MFIVMTAAACMPATCKGTYRRVAVVQVFDPEVKPKMISERARNVRRIVKTWERLNVGRTDACAYRKALAEAQEMANNLNSLSLSQ